MNTRSKASFLQDHYNIVTVANNSSVIFTRFLHLLIVYISLKKGLDSLTKVKTSKYWYFEVFSEANPLEWFYVDTNSTEVDKDAQN